jgi:hypothetical protein
LPALLVASLALFGLAGGCRSIAICSSEECRADLVRGGSATGGDSAGGNGPSDGSGAPSEGSGAPSAALAEGGAAGVGEPAVGAGGAFVEPPEALTCEPNMADCDGSRLTGCESDVTWAIRHCGACGQMCDGLCMGGRCEPTVLVQPTYAVSMVATETTGFALVTDMFTHSLVRVDFKTASSSELLSDVDSETLLAASGDRVYVLDVTNNVLHSMPLDGSELQVEDVASPLSIGGTSKGAYYVSRQSPPETEEDDGTYRLHFRPKGSQAWQPIFEGAEFCRILSSSSFGMVLATYPDEYSEDSEAQLSLWDGSVETALGMAPSGFMEAAAVKDGYVAMLTYDDVTAVTQLWWIKAGEPPERYDVPNPSNGTAAQLIVYDSYVQLYVHDQGKAYLQSFSVAGPVIGRFGMLPAVNVVRYDRQHVWYGVYDDWLTMRFLRSTWLDLKF